MRLKVHRAGEPAVRSVALLENERLSYRPFARPPSNGKFTSDRCWSGRVSKQPDKPSRNREKCTIAKGAVCPRLPL